MEYSPAGDLPRVSRVDAGTVELVRSAGVEVVTSADLVQHVTQRWTPAQLESHLRAAVKVGQVVQEAFTYIGVNLMAEVTEGDVARFIRRRFRDMGLVAAEGPIVAANAHAGDPHYDPGSGGAAIKQGDWVLIDLWAKEAQEDAIYADITWVAYVGSAAPRRQQEVFELVAGARDAALEFLDQAHRAGRALQGWEVDQVARRFIARRGHGKQFTHRLGHSLGTEVHGDAVNLDSWETRDTRSLLPGLGVTIEPGVYLPDFGVRSEIDVYLSPDGPQVTTPVQREVVLIG
jgi:Xaa-Pro aminopeptidase